MNSPNQDAERERHIVYQFWLNDHDRQVLWQEWSDGTIEAADVMLADRIVDLQHWDAASGTVWNHLADSDWSLGSTPYGIEEDLPVPEISADHETIQEPPLAPAQKTVPVPSQAAKSAQAQAYAHQGPPGETPEPKQEQQQEKTAPRTATPRSACVLPVREPVPPTVRSKPRRGLLRAIGPWIWVLIMIGAISKCSEDTNRNINARSPSSSLSSSSPAPAPTTMARRALMVTRGHEVVVRRALLIKTPAPRAQRVSSPGELSAQAYLFRMPYDESFEVRTVLKGYLPNEASLPLEHNSIGDMWMVGSTPWVWVTTPGTVTPQWVDP